MALPVETYELIGVKPTYTVDYDMQLDFPFDWTEYLLLVGDVIDTVEFVVDSRLDIVNFGHDDTHATVWLKLKDDVARDLKETLQVTCRITTDNVPPRIDDRSIWLKFKQR